MTRITTAFVYLSVLFLLNIPSILKDCEQKGEQWFKNTLLTRVQLPYSRYKNNSLYRIKLVAILSSRSGNETPVFMAASLHFKNHAIFLPSMRMICIPSRSFFTSSGVKP